MQEMEERREENDFFAPYRKHVTMYRHVVSWKLGFKSWDNMDDAMRAERIYEGQYALYTTVPTDDGQARWPAYTALQQEIAKCNFTWDQWADVCRIAESFSLQDHTYGGMGIGAALCASTATATARQHPT